MMHRHVWKIETRETLPSAWEQMNARLVVETLKGGSAEMFEKSVIVTYRCEVCGSQKVNRI